MILDTHSIDAAPFEQDLPDVFVKVILVQIV